MIYEEYPIKQKTKILPKNIIKYTQMGLMLLVCGIMVYNTLRKPQEAIIHNNSKFNTIEVKYNFGKSDKYIQKSDTLYLPVEKFKEKEMNKLEKSLQ